MILIVLLVINIIPPEKNVDSSPFLLEKGELSMIVSIGAEVSAIRNCCLSWRSKTTVRWAVKPAAFSMKRCSNTPDIWTKSWWGPSMTKWKKS